MNICTHNKFYKKNFDKPDLHSQNEKFQRILGTIWPNEQEEIGKNFRSVLEEKEQKQRKENLDADAFQQENELESSQRQGLKRKVHVRKEESKEDDEEGELKGPNDSELKEREPFEQSRYGFTVPIFEMLLEKVEPKTFCEIVVFESFVAMDEDSEFIEFIMNKLKEELSVLTEEEELSVVLHLVRLKVMKKWLNDGLLL